MMRIAKSLRCDSAKNTQDSLFVVHGNRRWVRQLAAR
jgi:hypothetical protein